MFEELIVFVKNLILSFGPFGIFFGMFLESSIIPIPSEVVLFSAGAVGFSIIDVTVYGALGSTTGAVVGYYIGKKGGRPVLDRYGRYLLVTKDKLSFVDNWFKRWGDYSVLVSRLIPLIPFKIFSIAAGISRMDLKNFVLWTFVGSIPRCFLLAYLGSKMMETGNIALMIIVIAALIAIPIGISKIKNRKK